MLLKDGAIPLIDKSQVLKEIIADDNQISFFDLDLKSNPEIPDEFLGYYNFIKENSPVSPEQIFSFFNKKAVGDIESDLLIMELNSYIQQKDNLYYI